MHPLVDSHSHLAMLTHRPLAEVLSRAKESGIEKMISVSTDEASWVQNQNLARDYSHVYYTLGAHPHDAIHWDGWKANLLNLYNASPCKEKCVAIGEMGLDYFYTHSPKDVQIAAFEDQLKVANALELPIVIHCRDAFDELYEGIRKIGLNKRGGVMHCFTGDVVRAKQALDLGLSISFSGILTFKSADSLREAAKIVPDANILVETDCPFLTPVPHRGEKNEPFYLPHTVHTLAATRKQPEELVRELTYHNTVNLFRLS